MRKPNPIIVLLFIKKIEIQSDYLNDYFVFTTVWEAICFSAKTYSDLGACSNYFYIASFDVEGAIREVNFRLKLNESL